MTKLEAIRRMLRSIGESAPSTLETGQPTDAGDAEQILDEDNLTVQSEGWLCNTIPERVYSPVSGTITVPANVIRVIPAHTDTHRKLAPQGSTLYDFDNDTATFTADVTLKTIVLLPFESLPNGLSHLVVAHATATFQRFKRRGIVDEGLLSQRLSAARVQAEREDNEAGPSNVLATNAAAQMLGGRDRMDDSTQVGSWPGTN